MPGTKGETADSDFSDFSDSRRILCIRWIFKILWIPAGFSRFCGFQPDFGDLKDVSSTPRILFGSLRNVLRSSVLSSSQEKKNRRQLIRFVTSRDQYRTNWNN